MKYLLAILLFFSISSVNAQSTFKQYDFETVDSLQKVAPRNLIVFIEAEWCKYCKAMQRKVFPAENVSSLIASDYYFVTMDGESTEPITFRGETFRFKPTGNNTGVHELAEALGAIDGKLDYPTLVVLNPQYEILFQKAAFIGKRPLQKILMGISAASEK